MAKHISRCLSIIIIIMTLFLSTIGKYLVSFLKETEILSFYTYGLLESDYFIWSQCTKTIIFDMPSILGTAIPIIVLNILNYKLSGDIKKDSTSVAILFFAATTLSAWFIIERVIGMFLILGWIS